MVVLCPIAHAEMDMLFIANVYILAVPVQQSGVEFPLAAFMCVYCTRVRMWVYSFRCKLMINDCKCTC